MDKLITREEYMNNSSKLHFAYNCQFVTEETKQYVKTSIGLGKIAKSKDQHLNDVCKMANNGAGNWLWDFAPINIALLKDAQEFDSRSTRTCVSKAAAVMLLIEAGITNSAVEHALSRGAK